MGKRNRLVGVYYIDRTKHGRLKRETYTDVASSTFQSMANNTPAGYRKLVFHRVVRRMQQERRCMYYQASCETGSKLKGSRARVWRCIAAACYFFVTPRDYRSLLLSRLYRKRQTVAGSSIITRDLQLRYLRPLRISRCRPRWPTNQGPARPELPYLLSRDRLAEDATRHAPRRPWPDASIGPRYRNRSRFPTQIRLGQRLLTGNFRNSYYAVGSRKNYLRYWFFSVVIALPYRS